MESDMGPGHWLISASGGEWRVVGLRSSNLGG